MDLSRYPASIDGRVSALSTAIVHEAIELQRLTSWKWWKKQTPDAEQVSLELIDIWHFGLSILLQGGKSSDELAELIVRKLKIGTDQPDFRLDLEAFASATLADREFHIDLFGRLMAGVDMSFEQLYRGYVGKNVLNFFRQDHGYQEGSYRKHWNDGREDNEHLTEVLLLLDATSLAFKDDLYEALSRRYAS
jgi:dimeric dUTPase (all-alpha-NTP-PPase superfamily)